MKKLHVPWDIFLVFLSTVIGVIFCDNWKIILKETDSAIWQSIIHSGRLGISCIIAILMVAFFEFEPHKMSKRRGEDDIEKIKREDGRKSNFRKRLAVGFFFGIGWSKIIGEML